MPPQPVPPPTILVVDDETPIRSIVRAAVESDGGTVYEAASGARALEIARAERPSLVVLDLGLPDVDGLAVCEALRRWSAVPILVLSARHSDEEKARLLDAGADDYLTKPFSTLELQARLRAQLRRARMGPVPGGDVPLVVGEVTVDLAHRRALRAGEPVHLTPTEWALLTAFVTNPDRPLTHRQLFAAVWPDRAHGDAQAYLRVFVGHLRRKLEADSVRPRHLRTESGVGYRWVP